MIIEEKWSNFEFGLLGSPHLTSPFCSPSHSLSRSNFTLSLKLIQSLEFNPHLLQTGVKIPTFPRLWVEWVKRMDLSDKDWGVYRERI